MRKPRDYDGELKALEDKARQLKGRKVQQLGELVIATGADRLTPDELAGALLVLADTKEAGKRESWARRGASFFAGRGSTGDGGTGSRPTQAAGAQPQGHDAGAAPSGGAASPPPSGTGTA